MLKNVKKHAMNKKRKNVFYIYVCSVLCLIMCQVTKSPYLTSLTPCSRALCAFQDRQDFAGALEQSGLDALPVATNNACGYQRDLNQVLRVQVRHLTTEPS